MNMKTCSERLPEMLKVRLSEIKEALEDENKREEFYERVLAIAKKIIFDIQLSTGGPADGFMVIVDPETMEIEEIEYYFRDWFDGASMKLEGKDFEMIEEMFFPILETLEY